MSEPYQLDAVKIETANGEIVPLDGRTVYIDFCGMTLQQNTLDIVTQEANRDPRESVNIILRRLSAVGGVPRLILDSQSIYDAAVELLKQKDLANRLDSGMTETERGHPYSVDEAESLTQTYPDEYVREMVRFLLNRITRLSK